MRKILGYALCLLLIGFAAYAGMSTLFFRGTSGGVDVSDVILWATFEDTSTPFEIAPAGSGYYNGSATNWSTTSKGALDINATAALSGSGGVDNDQDAVSSNFIHITWVTSTDEPFDPDAGFVGFELYFNTLDSSSRAWKFNTATDDAGFYVSGGNMYAFWPKSGGGTQAVNTTGFTVSTGVLYRVIVRYNTTSNLLEICAYNSSGTLLGSCGSQTATDLVTIPTPLALQFGNPGGPLGTLDQYLDKLVTGDNSKARSNSEIETLMRTYDNYPG